MQPTPQVTLHATIARKRLPAMDKAHLGKRIVCTTWGSLGDLYPYLALALELQLYDHADRVLVDDLVRFLEAGPPPIVFTLGSSAVWIAEDFYELSIRAVRELNQRAVLLVGNREQLRLASVPDSVGIFEYAPHNLVMSYASIIVHQGGIGTTAQALRAGRPMLVVPFGQDQPDNARAVTSSASHACRSASATRYP